MAAIGEARRNEKSRRSVAPARVDNRISMNILRSTRLVETHQIEARYLRSRSRGNPLGAGWSPLTQLSSNRAQPSSV